MSEKFYVEVDDNGVVLVTITGPDGRVTTGTMALEEAEALGNKLLIAVRHFKQRTGRL